MLPALMASRTPRKVSPQLRDHVILVGSNAVTQTFIARAERSGAPAVMVVEDPVEAGRLVLGTWQGIYLWEHRRQPHHRTVVAHLA